MRNGFKWAIGLSSAVLIIGGAGITTGIPVHWTKGLVVGTYCESTEDDYLCLVELVPDGALVKAESGSDIAHGKSVELRVWVDPFSGTATYHVVR
jgi:hypothetical protein